MVIQAIVLQKKEKGKRERKRKKKLLISQWCFQIREDKKKMVILAMVLLKIGERTEKKNIVIVAIVLPK